LPVVNGVVLLDEHIQVDFRVDFFTPDPG